MIHWLCMLDPTTPLQSWQAFVKKGSRMLPSTRWAITCLSGSNQMFPSGEKASQPLLLPSREVAEVGWMVIAWPEIGFNTFQNIQLNIISAPSGSIHSPNYPNPYDSNDDCAWILEVDPNHRIEFTFIDFDVEPHSNCSYDYVALYDGPSEQDPLILLHCGQNVPTPNTLYSTSNKMYVRMKADGSITSKGFLAKCQVSAYCKIS